MVYKMFNVETKNRNRGWSCHLINRETLTI